ncbi:unnamed protein product, partial [Gongylonema pulchrum]|uniref:Dynein light chain n=1 Tax=Gongylonema pulchrum TaxID=637853 RepID=A0A183E2P4_9BILA
MAEPDVDAMLEEALDKIEDVKSFAVQGWGVAGGQCWAVANEQCRRGVYHWCRVIA